MTIKQAIQKAIEGGWSREAVKGTEDWYFNDIFLDPLFWKSLGKAMGWNEHEITIKVPAQTVHRIRRDRSGGEDIEWPAHSRKRKVMTKKWLKEWHRFIDHLADGGTAESFFKYL